MRKYLFGVAVATTLLAGTPGRPAIAVEAIGVLNDTGQSTCYDTSYNAVPCDEASTGDEAPLLRQDGRFGRDAAAEMGRLPKIGGGDAGFDFTRVCMSGEDEGHGACASPPPLPADLERPQPNDWACLRDNVTGLTFTLGNPEQVTWDVVSSTAQGSYIQRANASARCGLSSDWRLPHRREGWSLLNMQRMFPNLVDSAYFPILGNNTMQRIIYVWSADPTAWHSMFQWTISFGSNATGMQCRKLAPPIPCDTYPNGVTEWAASVLLVNGAWRQPSSPDSASAKSDERWQIRGDGLIATDTATGLTWDRCSWGQVGSTCEGSATIFPNWVDAMQVARIANEQRYKGFHDWRLPNIHGLESLVKMDVNPAFDAQVFPNTLVVDNYSYYWTSTSLEYVPGIAPAAFTVEFLRGATHDADKVYSLPPGAYPYVGAVRLVRGGSEWEAFDGVSERLFWDDFDGGPSRVASVH